MGTKETPHIEVLDPVRSVEEVQRGSLTERHSEESASVATCRRRVTAKESCQVLECDISESAQVTLCDALLGSCKARHKNECVLGACATARLNVSPRRLFGIKEIVCEHFLQFPIDNGSLMVLGRDLARAAAM